MKDKNFFGFILNKIGGPDCLLFIVIQEGPELFYFLSTDVYLLLRRAILFVIFPLKFVVSQGK